MEHIVHGTRQKSFCAVIFKKRKKKSLIVFVHHWMCAMSGGYEYLLLVRGGTCLIYNRIIELIKLGNMIKSIDLLNQKSV